MTSKKNQKINRIIDDIKYGHPFKICPAYDNNKKEIGAYIFYYSETNRCFQQGIWSYEGNAILLEDEPQRYSEKDIRDKLKIHLKQK